MALAELYRVTREQRYLSLASLMFNWRLLIATGVRSLGVFRLPTPAPIIRELREEQTHLRAYLRTGSVGRRWLLRMCTGLHNAHDIYDLRVGKAIEDDDSVGQFSLVAQNWRESMHAGAV